MDTDQLRRSILDYLETHNVMTIASCQDNVPWAAAVFYASDGFDLYFLSNPRSRHGTCMAANPMVSAAIHEDYHDWRTIQGIQLEGKAERLRSLKLQAHFWMVYSRKFPFVKEFFQPGNLQQLLQPKLAGIRLYRIVPQKIWFIDNRRGFGHREMLDLTQEATEALRRRGKEES
ncbi:MAG: hypothetical protein A3H27_11470 [Acidobacteria bacterium RIFCSPLOWO2_02_FULL_59_13]|nr:MAG: hypothetical protein A3H27_11470 [Acidobacteria bacterium RIFCSPLOWO2_02_FULL_59_13]